MYLTTCGFHDYIFSSLRSKAPSTAAKEHTHIHIAGQSGVTNSGIKEQRKTSKNVPESFSPETRSVKMRVRPRPRTLAGSRPSDIEKVCGVTDMGRDPNPVLRQSWLSQPRPTEVSPITPPIAANRTATGINSAMSREKNLVWRYGYLF